MSSVNKVILIGRLGKDPDLRYTTGHQPVAHLSIATSDNYTNKQGERVETTEWHKVSVWGKQAEQVGEYLSKGRLVYVEGKLRTSSWTDKAGQKRYTTEIVANTVQFLDSGKGDRAARGAGAPKAAPAADDGGIDLGEPQPPPPDEEDIPF